MSDFFVMRDQDLSVKQTLSKVDPVLYSDPNPEIFFLFSEVYPKKTLDLLKRFIYNNLPSGSRICFLYVLKYVPDKKEFKSHLEKFFVKNTIDLTKYIPKGSKVITVGRALYSTTYDTDITVDAFYDIRWNKSYFYSPFIKSWVFPVDYIDAWFNRGKGHPKDNFEKFFAKNQIKECSLFKLKLIRIPVLREVIIEKPNEFLKANFGKGTWAYDIETDSLDWTRANIGDLSLSNDGITGYYLKWSDIDPEILNEWFVDKYLIAANGGYDSRVLRRHGVFNATVHYDTVHAGHTLNEARSNTVKAHAFLYTMFGGYDLDLKKYIWKHNITNYLKIPDSTRIPYSCMDAIIEYQIYEATKKQLAEDPEVEKFFIKDRMPAVTNFIDVSMNGFCIDWHELRLVGQEIKQMIEDLKEKIFTAFGKKINIDSGLVLGGFLEHELGWECIERAKAGYYKTNSGILIEWKKLGHEEADLILEYSSLSTIYDTFVGEEQNNTGMWQYRKADDKIYPGFGVMMARTMRFLCSDPNGQNWVKQGSIAKIVRRIFKSPSPDYYLVEWDAAGLQLRIAGLLSNDINMRKAFTSENSDIHSQTAQKIFRDDVSLDEFLKNKKRKGFKEHRQTSKKINFGLIFNQSGRSFGLGTLKENWILQDCDDFIKSKKLERELEKYISYNKSDRALNPISEDDCKYVVCGKEIRKEFFDLYYGVKAWIEGSIEFGKKEGYVRSSFGARRLVSKLLYQGIDTDYKEIKNLYNICCNSPVQTHEVVLVCRAMILLIKYIKEKKYLSTIDGMIHDAVVMYIHKDELEDLCRKILEFFAIDYAENNGIPMEVEIDIADVFKGEIWGFDGFSVSLENINTIFNKRRAVC